MSQLRKCGGHCPLGNVNDQCEANCLICKNTFHLPCYDIINKSNQLFVTKNVVFLCDTCLLLIETNNSPKRKFAGSDSPHYLRQSKLSVNNDGKVSVSAQQLTTPVATANCSSSNNARINSLVHKVDQLIQLNNDQSRKLDKLMQLNVEKSNQIDNSAEKISGKLAENSQIVTGLKSAVDSVHSILLRPKTLSYATVAGENGKSQKTPIRASRVSTYSTVLKSVQSTGTPTAAKSKRNELALIENASRKTVSSVKIPSPKNGTKNAQIGKPLEVRPSKQHTENPFSKSLWVSRFHPDTTVEEIASYITESTPLNDSSKFRCTKLVKKDQEISKMSFVSFKIDVSPEDYDIIVQPEYWPANNSVREFKKIQPPKTDQWIPRSQFEPAMTGRQSDNFPPLTKASDTATEGASSPSAAKNF